MNEYIERQNLIKEAKTWTGTPFRWQACIKGKNGGVDCGHYPAGVINFSDTSLQKIDIGNLPKLPPQWFMHKSDESFINIIKQYAEEYQLKQRQIPQPGDLVVVEYGRDWAHAAIVVKWPRIIGAIMNFYVAEWPDITASPHFGARKRKFFNFWAKKHA